VIDGFIVDFYCHAVGLVIEVDGGIHQTQKDYDSARERIIQTRGLSVLHITNEDIHNDLYNTISQIRDTCMNLAELQK
jgi:very-short-patch-repair endonuclease